MIKKTLLLTLLLARMPVWCGATSGTTSFNFLTIPVAARPTALGQAFVSVPGEIQGIANNPAASATLQQTAYSLQHLSYVEDVSQQALTYGRAPNDRGTAWGVLANYFRVGGIERTVATLSNLGDGYTSQGNFSTYDLMLAANVSQQMSRSFFVGTNVKFLQESLSDASSTGAAVDAGVLYVGGTNRAWNMGASVQHVGFASKFISEPVKLPMTFRAGFSAHPFAQWLFTTEYSKRVDTSGEFNVGAEVTPRRFLSLRLGYKSPMTNPDLGGLSQFSAGVGLRSQRFSFDYAFIPLGDLGVTHRISLNFYVKPIFQ